MSFHRIVEPTEVNLWTFWSVYFIEMVYLFSNCSYTHWNGAMDISVYQCFYTKQTTIILLISLMRKTYIIKIVR